MGKVFSKGARESKLLSKIESSKEYERRTAIGKVRDLSDTLANAITSKLVESGLVETTSQNSLEKQLTKCLEELTRAEDFDVDFSVAPFRTITTNPNIVSLYVTAFVIEKVINHRETVDVYGSDEDIYACINRQVNKYIA
ncbi:MAG: hypothetical protein SWH68_06370 [Thermodesulfobacteriota bacterium]|nr:hypothetical protein [Thermodesulfobacteriota bacterium]